MGIRKILLISMAAIIIFLAGMFTGKLIDNAKISDLQKLVKNLKQNITEANEHALVLQNSLDQIKQSVGKLESINNELRAETRTVEKNLNRAIGTSENIGNGIKNASIIVSESRKDIDELTKIIQGIKNNSVTN